MPSPPLPTLLVLAFSLLTMDADPVDDLVRSEMTARSIPGVALAVTKNGQELKRAEYGYSDLENNVPMHRDAVFEIGSVTTHFTAAAVFVLIQQGKLSLEDLISKHLPGCPESWQKIKVRHLVEQTSGIKTYAMAPGFELARRLPQSTFIDMIAAMPMEFAPGEKARYSVSNYTLLGFIVENVSRKNFWVFLAENVFTPLNMSTAGDREPRIIVPNRVRGYQKDKSGNIINRDFELTDMFAAGAMIASIDDLLKWDASLDSEKVLTAESKQQMWRPGILKNGQKTEYGAGCHLDTFKGFRNIQHIGATAGFSCNYSRFPEASLTIIVAANTSESATATRLMLSVADIYLSQSPPN